MRQTVALEPKWLRIQTQKKQRGQAKTPGHERAARAILLDEIPDAHVSLSSEVLPRIREWPRLSTTLLNAYLEPVLVGYISNLAAGLDAAGVYTPQRFLMQSNGGVMPFVAAVAGGALTQFVPPGSTAGLGPEPARVLRQL